jgi:hypothetical protein
MVETQMETPPPVAEEEELPRRTRPRRRRGTAAPSEPLQMVETQPADNPQAPPTP